eukprot:m51a1_g10523 putative nucleolar protein of 40 kda-like (332) ;mRNA; r:221780-222929
MDDDRDPLWGGGGGGASADGPPRVGAPLPPQEEEFRASRYNRGGGGGGSHRDDAGRRGGGGDRRRGGDDVATPPVNSVHRVKVVRIQPFGAFCEVPGYSRHGLLHVSQMSASRVENPEEVVSVGEELWAKVTRVSEEGDGKYSLSLRGVSQTDGEDKDPNNLLSSQQRGGPGGSGEARKIEVGAVLKTTCRRCGGQGHLASECYASGVGGGTKYELLSTPPREREEMREEIARTEREKQQREADEKHKATGEVLSARQALAILAAAGDSKKRARGGSSSGSSSSSSSDSSDADERERKKRRRDGDEGKKRKHKHHHKHKHKHHHHKQRDDK